jgi:GAF domain-containing protein
MENSDRQPVDQVSFLDQEAQEFIQSVAQELHAADDAGDALHDVMRRVTAFVGAEAASIFVVDASTGDLMLQYAIGKVGEKIVGLRLHSGQGVVGWVIKNSEDLIVPYPGLDARFFEGVDERTGFSTRSILCSPIRRGNRTIGAFEVLNKQEGTFNDDDLVLLRAISHSVADLLPPSGA